MSLYKLQRKYVSFDNKFFDTEDDLFDYYQTHILEKYRMGTSVNPTEVIQFAKFILNDSFRKYNNIDMEIIKQYTAETTPTSRFPILNIKITYIAEDNKNNFKFSRDYVSPCGFISVSEFAHIIEETFEKFINSKEYKFLFENKKGKNK